jgi:Zn-dependent peptidase ImmA (M78 family)
MNICKKFTDEEVLKLAIKNASQTHGGVDIVQIACELGIEVISITECDPYFNAAIKYYPEEKKFQISVNDSHSRNRVRFSIAHEIAHYVLHKNQIIKEGMMTRSSDENEIEEQADNLAGKILIPDELLDEFTRRNNILKEKEITKDQLSWMSSHFRVSYIVAAIRLRNLGYKVPYISFSYVA